MDDYIIRDTEEEEKMLDEIREEVDAKMKELGLMSEAGRPMFGSCHTRWAIEKELLKEKYNYDYKTPQEKNPGVRFD